jgi:endonuclease YncB( thermonuclease family)
VASWPLGNYLCAAVVGAPGARSKPPAAGYDGELANRNAYMAPWHSRPSVGRTGTQVVDGGTVAIVLALAGILGVYAYKRAHAPPPTVLVGHAFVIDGDTIDLAGTRLRLEGIDAPESIQTCTDAHGAPWNCGETATRELRSHLRGHELTCGAMGLDRYHRVLGICRLPDGSDVNAWMVRQGWALAYLSRDYRSEEAEAKAARRGVWAGGFLAPSEWRRRHIR